jgi:Arc/MetJ-type ribon-helix-helix transcriptional regulator
MTIHLPPEIENSIQAAVHSGHFASVDAAMTKAASLLLQQLKQQQAQAPAANPVEAVPAHKPIWEVFQELSADVPDEVWDSLPPDLSEQHDHYIYGTPKRPAG